MSEIEFERSLLNHNASIKRLPLKLAPLEKEMATDSSIPAWKIPWKEKPGKLQFMGSQRGKHNLETIYNNNNVDSLGPLSWLVQESPLWDRHSGVHTTMADKQPVGPLLATSHKMNKWHHALAFKHAYPNVSFYCFSNMDIYSNGR